MHVDIKEYKNQIIVYIITAFFQTVLMSLFLIFYHEPISLVLTLIGVILVVWIVATLKIVSSVLAIKKIREKEKSAYDMIPLK